MNDKQWYVKDRSAAAAGTIVMASAVGMLFFPASWPPQVPYLGAVVWTLLSLAVFVIGFIVLFLSMEEREPFAGTHCEDCGQKLIFKTVSAGYSSRDGKQRTFKKWHCPSSSTTRCNGSANKTTSSLYQSYFAGLQQTATMCGHDPRRFNCHSCLDAMVREHKLTPEEADLLR